MRTRAVPKCRRRWREPGPPVPTCPLRPETPVRADVAAQTFQCPGCVPLADELAPLIEQPGLESRRSSRRQHYFGRVDLQQGGRFVRWRTACVFGSATGCCFCPTQ